MPYIGKQPANVPVTADDIPNDSITAAKIVDAAITIDDIGPNAVGNSEMADDAIGLNELSATGTTNTSTFLRGDNSWAVPPTTDISGKLNLSGGAMTGAITTNSTFDGVDIATRDAVLTSTTTTANAALPKAGGTMTGGLSGTTAAFSSTITSNGQAQLNNNNLIALNTGATSEWIAKRTSSGEGIHITTTNASGADTQRLAITSNADTANFLIKASNVGIGTTSPATATGFNSPAFEVAGSEPSIVLSKTGADSFAFVNHASHLKLLNDTDDRAILHIHQDAPANTFIINSSGNVGLGTTPPSATSNSSYKQLFVNTGGALVDSGGSGPATMVLNNSYIGSGNNNYATATQKAARIVMTSGRLTFDTAPSVSANAQQTFAERMRITDAGNVGIGTTSPSKKLHATTFYLGNGSDNNIIEIGTWGHALNFTDGTDTKITFATYKQSVSGTDRAVIVGKDESSNSKFYISTSSSSYFNGGKVGIGTTSPSGTFHINSTANTNATTTYITRGDGTNSLPASIDTQTSLLLMNSSDTYSNLLSIISAPTGTSGINFGDSADENIGQIGYYNNGDTMRFTVGAAEKIRLTSDGLTFNGDTAAANALDDYEEGTFTPSITGGTGAPSGVNWSYRYGRYTKIGNQVTVWLDVYLSSISSLGSGQVSLTGLPFTSNNWSGLSAIGVPNIERLATGLTSSGVYAVVPSNDTRVALYLGNLGTGGMSGLDWSSHADGNTRYRLTATYSI